VVQIYCIGKGEREEKIKPGFSTIDWGNSTWALSKRGFWYFYSLVKGDDTIREKKKKRNNPNVSFFEF